MWYSRSLVSIIQHVTLFKNAPPSPVYTKVMHCKIVFVKVESASLNYLKAFIDLDTVTLLVL